MFKIKNKIFAWSLYDFASQPFSTIIVTFIYSAFFTTYIVEDVDKGTLLWTRVISISSIIAAILSPILGAIADRNSSRKLMLIITTYVSIIFIGLLYFPEKGDIMFSLIFFAIANVAFELSTVFYNSFLPDLSNNQNSGKISGNAWGFGFVGGLISLFICLSMFDVNQSSEIPKINILVAIWFFLFSAPAFIFLKEKKKSVTKKLSTLNQLKSTFTSIKEYKIIFKFFIARLFYNDALITIFSLGGIYAVGTVGFELSEVFILGIFLNISAAIGSFIFGYVEDKIGSKRSILITLYLLIFSTLIAFFAPYTSSPKITFWISAILLGLMVGPNQSSSRSLLSKIIPVNKKNEFYGFFALTGKATSFVGPLLFGIISANFSQQIALWIVILLFCIGTIIFKNICFDKG